MASPPIYHRPRISPAHKRMILSLVLAVVMGVVGILIWRAVL